jgi:hypothetical protein
MLRGYSPSFRARIIRETQSFLKMHLIRSDQSVAWPRVRCGPLPPDGCCPRPYRLGHAALYGRRFPAKPA